LPQLPNPEVCFDDSIVVGLFAVFNNKPAVVALKSIIIFGVED
jgi:hypothetical protein